VLDSTSIFMILRVPKQEELVVETLGLPEELVDYLATLERRNGEWSELLYFLRGEDSRLQGDILRIAPTPLDYWAFTSSAQDVARRRALEAERGLLEALGILSGVDTAPYRPWFAEEASRLEVL
jgi:conjugal transfer ATP-binding protein TraC